MHSGIFIVFCGTLVFVKTFPALVYDRYNPNTGEVDEIEIEFRDNYKRPEFKPRPCLRSHNGDVKCFDYNEILETVAETPEYSPLPYNPIEMAGRQLEQDQPFIYEPNIGNIEHPAATELLPLNYNIYNYDSSPIHTYIHGLVPQDTSVFYGDVYPPGDSPFNRLARRTTSYEEFLAQLSHDAQMNNILPTMPFVRTAGSHYYVPYAGSAVPVQAYFPQAVRGCARPFLFSCSPIIYRGVLAHNGYPYAPKVQVIPASYKESLQNHKVTRDKVKPVHKNTKNIHNDSKDSVSDNYTSN